MTRVAFAATEDRKIGVRAALKGLALNPVRGKEVRECDDCEDEFYFRQSGYWEL